MQTVNETNAPSSATGSGLKNMVFNGLKALFPFLGGKKSPAETMTVVTTDEGFFIAFADGTKYAGPYGREKDAKGQLTRLRKSYTPAARKVHG